MLQNSFVFPFYQKQIPIYNYTNHLIYCPLHHNKWLYNNESNPPKQKYTSLASSTGKNFYRNNNKLTQSSYGRKYYLSNGYDINKNPQKKKNYKINSKNENIIKNNKGIRVSSVEKNSYNNRIIERFINQYKTNPKKVLYDMNVIENKGLLQNSNSNWNNIKSASIKDNKKIIQNEKNYNDLPFLRNQIQDKNKKTQKKKKNFAQPCSETNIININNFINFFSDLNNLNNITYNNNNFNSNLINNNNNNINNLINNNNNKIQQKCL